MILVCTVGASQMGYACQVRESLLRPACRSEHARGRGAVQQAEYARNGRETADATSQRPCRDNAVVWKSSGSLGPHMR